MRIGLDFDNTIVSYDDVFHKVALEKGLIPEYLAVNKIAVRDHLRINGQEGLWTEMQGYVYGARMQDVEPFVGAIDAIRTAKSKGYELFIVSHKTKYPFMGPKYDLHDAAREWISKFLIHEGVHLIDPINVNFRETKEEKVDRIAELSCDYFVDDLPEILLRDNFPPSTKRILFDPQNHHNSDNKLSKVSSWHQLNEMWNR